ncbi:MAG: hypothetical protein ABIG95_04760 [Candidatus Woesearchaeota archaeon]
MIRLKFRYTILLFLVSLWMIQSSLAVCEDRSGPPWSMTSGTYECCHGLVCEEGDITQTYRLCNYEGGYYLEEGEWVLHSHLHQACDCGCTGAACNNCSCTTASDPACDDDNVCTDDSCDIANGKCVNTDSGECECRTANDPCDDNNRCTDDSCNMQTGTCNNTRNWKGCDDLNNCTNQDRCDYNSECIGQPICAGNNTECGCSACTNCNSLDNVSEPYCKEGDVFKQQDDYSCANMTCEKTTQEILLEECTDGCAEGTCSQSADIINTNAQGEYTTIITTTDSVDQTSKGAIAFTLFAAANSGGGSGGGGSGGSTQLKTECVGNNRNKGCGILEYLSTQPTDPEFPIFNNTANTTLITYSHNLKVLIQAHQKNLTFTQFIEEVLLPYEQLNQLSLRATTANGSRIFCGEENQDEFVCLWPSNNIVVMLYIKSEYQEQGPELVYSIDKIKAVYAGQFPSIIPTDKCLDSDDGLKYYQKGTLKFGYYTEEDYCQLKYPASPVNKSKRVTQCSEEQGCYLIENYCIDDNYLARSKAYKCNDGCRNGACNPEGCVDTDTGKDYYTQGTVSFMGEDEADRCYNLNILIETYCSQGKKEDISFTCPYGCDRGACLLKCKETDAGLDYNKKGNVTYNRQVFKDTCLDSEQLREWYCDQTQNATSQTHQCISHDCRNDACQPISLDHYPLPFMDSTFKALVVVGEHSDDLPLAKQIITGFGIPNFKNITNDTKITNFRTKNLIVIGDENFNSVTAQLLVNYPSKKLQLTTGEAIIRLYNHSSGFYTLLIAGYTQADLERAVGVLINCQNCVGFTGMEIIVKQGPENHPILNPT